MWSFLQFVPLLMGTVLPHCYSWLVRELTPSSTSGVQYSLWYVLGSFGEQHITEQIVILVITVAVSNTTTL